MNRLQSRRHWLRRHAWPVFLTSALCIVWPGFVVATLHWRLGITTSVGGRPLSFGETVWLYLPDAVPCALSIHLAFLLTLWATRRPFRWWVWILALIFAGTPLGLECGRLLAEYLWKFNRSATAWEAIFAPAAGVLVTWDLALVADWMLNLGLSRERRRRIAAGRCVTCGYDLRAQIAAKRPNCPECGTPIPLPAARAQRSLHKPPLTR